MELSLIIGIIVFGGIVIMCVGLSLLSQSLNALDYNNSFDQDAYNQNPLIKLGSKYFHWRPKGSVVITRQKWKVIQNNIAREVENAKQEGIKLGKAQALKEVESHLEEQQEKSGFPKNPYKILDVNSTDSDLKIQEAYNKLVALYEEAHFYAYDSAFQELAAIRRRQIRRAFNKIASGVAPSEDEEEPKDFSKGQF